jgi:hypothetical protein
MLKIPELLIIKASTIASSGICKSLLDSLDGGEREEKRTQKKNNFLSRLNSTLSTAFLTGNAGVAADDDASERWPSAWLPK